MIAKSAALRGFVAALALVGWTLPALARDIALDSGAFGLGFGLPLFHLTGLLAFIAIGLWSGLLGGGTVWQFPALTLLGALAGCLIGGAGVALPFSDLGPVAGLVVVGVSIALGLQFPIISPGVVVMVLALYLGFPLAQMVRGAHLWYWLGFGSAALLGISGGLGLAVMLGRMPMALGVRTVGAALAATGVFVWLDRI